MFGIFSILRMKVQYSKAFNFPFLYAFILKTFGLSLNIVNVSYEYILSYEVKRICNIFAMICLVLVFQICSYFRIPMFLSSFLQNNPFLSKISGPPQVSFSEAIIIGICFS